LFPLNSWERVEARQATVIDEVCLVPEGSKLSIDLTGELAGILSLCQESKKPSHSGQAHAEQIKMVAGAGLIQAPTNTELRVFV